MSPSIPISLDRLPHGLSARITKVGGPDHESDQNGEPALEDLLLGLGFEEGAHVEVRHQGPFGGPLAVRVDDRLIALRPADAAAVLVETTLPIPDSNKAD